MGSTVITIDQAKVAEINQQTPLAVRQAESYLIESEEDYEGILPLGEEYGRRIDTIVALFEGTKENPGPKSLAYLTHKSLSNLQNEMTAPYERARELVVSKRKEWRQKIAAEQAAEESRRRQEAEAERQRHIQAEQTRLAEEAAAREADRKRQAAALEAKAKELKAQGDKTAAKVLQEQASNIATLAAQEKIEDAESAKVFIEQARQVPLNYAPVNGGVQKQKGSAVKKVWKIRILKPELLPVNLLIPPDGKKFDPLAYPRVRDLVDALGANHGLPDGAIEAYQDDQESIRRK